ncbi:MAG: hypothetical protein ACTSXD_05685 [Candidatus Heimdallarchaeaceae archaeon]
MLMYCWIMFLENISNSTSNNMSSSSQRPEFSYSRGDIKMKGDELN